MSSACTMRAVVMAQAAPAAAGQRAQQQQQPVQHAAKSVAAAQPVPPLCMPAPASPAAFLALSESIVSRRHLLAAVVAATAAAGVAAAPDASYAAAVTDMRKRFSQSQDMYDNMNDTDSKTAANGLEMPSSAPPKDKAPEPEPEPEPKPQAKVQEPAPVPEPEPAPAPVLPQASVQQPPASGALPQSDEETLAPTEPLRFFRPEDVPTPKVAPQPEVKPDVQAFVQRVPESNTPPAAAPVEAAKDASPPVRNALLLGTVLSAGVLFFLTGRGAPEDSTKVPTPPTKPSQGQNSSISEETKAEATSTQQPEESAQN